MQLGKWLWLCLGCTSTSLLLAHILSQSTTFFCHFWFSGLNDLNARHVSCTGLFCPSVKPMMNEQPHHLPVYQSIRHVIHWQVCCFKWIRIPHIRKNWMCVCEEWMCGKPCRIDLLIQCHEVSQHAMMQFIDCITLHGCPTQGDGWLCLNWVIIWLFCVVWSYCWKKNTNLQMLLTEQRSSG